MHLIELADKDKQEYNRFVANLPTGSFLQSWDWGQWQASLGRAVFRFKIQDSNGVTVGAMQLIKMPLPLGKFYLYAPYGPVTDLGLKIEDLRFLEQGIKEKFPEAIFIRIESKNSEIFKSLNHSIFKSPNIQPGKTLIIDISQTEEELLKQMHPKTRYNIRLAEKHGVEIKDEFDITIGHGLFAQEAATLIVETATRQGYKGYSNNYYQQLIDFLAVQNRGDLYLRIYKAIYQNKLLSSAIMFDYGDTRTFLFGGSAEENKNVMAPYLMHWQAIKDAKLAGLKYYDFWGTETSSGKSAGFVRFKLGFAHSTHSTSFRVALSPVEQATGSGSSSGIKEYAGAYDLVLNPLWYKIYLLSRKISQLTK
ncbi:MAG: peptidoglycan bridge formation glycyltransferase FemA/FemB family protein [Candidatus Doudnabacteria bacterium]|jgi:lipid II:glycine glycyltransferase (peptidoglycan interpeptide bridge formation enzyme)